jgi:predicted  nucleic acid-binding Zn-ribbon protein
MSSSSMTSSSSATSCLPTRILEGYQIDISEVPPDYCSNVKEALEDTLLAKVIACFTSLKGFLEKKLPRSAYNVLTPLAFTGNIDANISLDELYRYCCCLRQAIHELYVQDPLNTHCQTLDVLSQVVCEPPSRVNLNDEQAAAQARTAYVEQVRVTLYDLLALLMQYILDCVCQALLPPCSPAPGDDRLILACMTVKNDQIIDICNFCHRRYAGSFPALNYWLSLVPIIPLIAYAVERLCCYDWLKRDFSQRQDKQQASLFRGNLVNGLTSLLDRVDPSGSLRKEIFADNFAMPRSYATKFEQIISKVSSPAKIAELLQPGAFNLTKIIDKSVAEATSALQEAGVTPVVHAVASADEMPILRHLTTSPFAMAGDHVVLYHANDKVVGYAAYAPPPDIDQVKNDVTALKDAVAQVPQAADISQLRSDLEAVKGSVANSAQSSDLETVKNDVEAVKGSVANTAQAADVEQLRSDLAQFAQATDVSQLRGQVEGLQNNLAQFAQATDVSQLRDELEGLKGSVGSAAQAAALDEVKNDVEALKGSVANAAQSSALDAVKNDVEALKGSVANAAQSSALDPIRSDVEALKGSVANAARADEVGQLRSDLAQFAQATDVNQLRSDVEGVKNNLGNFAQATDVNQLRGQVDGVQNNLAQFAQATDVSQLRDELEGLKGSVSSAAQSSALDEVKNELEGLKGNLTNAVQPAALDPMKNDIDALKGDMASTAKTTDVSGIRDEVNGLKSQVDTLSDNLAKVAQPAAPTQEISDLQATIKALQDALAALRSEVDQLKSRNTGETGGTPLAEPPKE